MIDPIVYHPRLADHGLREYRVWPYGADLSNTRKPRPSGRWRSAR